MAQTCTASDHQNSARDNYNATVFKNDDSVNEQAPLQHGTALPSTQKSDLFTAEPLCESRWLHLSRRRVTFMKSSQTESREATLHRRGETMRWGRGAETETETEEREAKLMTRHKAGPSKFDERWEREGKSLM